MKATWQNTVLANSEDTVEIDGFVYFPVGSVNMEFLEESPTTSVCPWKGTASYYTVVVDGARNPDAAWIYREPKAAANKITAHIAFWRGIETE